MERQPASETVEDDLHTSCSKRKVHPLNLQLSLNFPSQTTLTSPERSLYAALSPSPQVSAQLKAACRTWSDHLWAQVCVICEERESAEIGRLKGFWEGGFGVEEQRSEGMDGAEDTEGEGEDEEWEKEVQETLESLAGVLVEEGSVLSFMRF